MSEGSNNLKRLANAFSGKREPIETTKIPHTPLKKMLSDAAALPEEYWASYAFERDSLRDKIPKDQWTPLFQGAVNCGQELARDTVKQHGTRLPRKLADKLGLTVTGSNKEMDGFAPTFAQFVLPNKITLFTRYSQAAQDAYDSFGENTLGMVQVENTLISHEIFHYLEEQQKDSIYTKTEKIQLWKKPFARFSTVASLGEIAGMAFAQEYLGLSFFPYVMDILLMYSLNIDAANVLYKSMVKDEAGSESEETPQEDEKTEI